MRYPTLLIALLLLPACQVLWPAGSAPVTYSTDQTAYAPGDEVQVHLENRTDQTIGYNLCFSLLERQTEQGWSRVEEADVVCTTIQHGLAPDEDASFTKELPGTLPGGSYRYTTEVEYRDDRRHEQLVTDVFSVED